MEESENPAFHLMDQFRVSMDTVSAWQTTPVLLGLILVSLLPFAFALWLGRRFNHKSIYLWGPVVAALFSIATSVAVSLLIQSNPMIYAAILNVLFAPMALSLNW